MYFWRKLSLGAPGNNGDFRAISRRNGERPYRADLLSGESHIG